MEGELIMNWYKIKDNRINLSLIKWYMPKDNKCIETNSFVITLDNEEERDEELRKLDEALEKGLHTISEFKLP